MAITKIIKVKVNPNAAINYVRNPDKTNERLLVSYDSCTESNIELCFKMALVNKVQNRKSEGVLAYHFIQSFAPTDEVTPEKAHELGMKFMEKTFGEKYSFICATHTDKGHIHNHFVMCAAERGMTGMRLDDNLSLLHTIQKNNDALCRQYGLSVIDKKRSKGKNYREWFEDKSNPSGSKKTQQKRAEERNEKRKAAYEAMSPAEKRLDKSKLKISTMRDTSQGISHEKIDLQKWSNVQNARRMQQIQKELQDRYGISYTEVTGHIKALRAHNNYLDTALAKNQKEISELRQLINDCVMYKKLKIYATNEQKAEDKGKYYQEHDTQLNAYHDAKFALESRNINLTAITSSNIKILQNRLEQAEQELENLKEQQLQNEREKRELQEYQKEIDTYLGKKHEDI